MAGGAKGFYLLGLVAEKQSMNKDALIYFKKAFEIDRTLWVAYEKICQLDVSAIVNVKNLFLKKFELDKQDLQIFESKNPHSQNQFYSFYFWNQKKSNHSGFKDQSSVRIVKKKKQQPEITHKDDYLKARGGLTPNSFLGKSKLKKRQQSTPERWTTSLNKHKRVKNNHFAPDSRKEKMNNFIQKITEKNQSRESLENSDRKNSEKSFNDGAAMSFISKHNNSRDIPPPPSLSIDNAKKVLNKRPFKDLSHRYSRSLLTASQGTNQFFINII